MKLPPLAGEYRYAVAVRDGSNLWLVLWIRRSKGGAFFVMIPRGDRDWDPHTSYHLDGTFHMKSYDHRLGAPQKRQALSGAFQGAEHLGQYRGFGPRSVGAICDPSDFSGIVEVPSDVLGPRDGAVIIDLVEPGCEPTSVPIRINQHKVFRDFTPWVVIRIGST